MTPEVKAIWGRQHRYSDELAKRDVHALLGEIQRLEGLLKRGHHRPENERTKTELRRELAAQKAESKKQLKRARLHEVQSLREAGATFEAIGTRLGITAGHARNLYEQALRWARWEAKALLGET